MSGGFAIGIPLYLHMYECVRGKKANNNNNNGRKCNKQFSELLINVLRVKRCVDRCECVLRFTFE